MTTKTRFSKQSMIETLETRLSYYEKIYGFRRDIGTAQVQGEKDFDRVIAYGEYEAYQTILEELSE